MSALRYRELRSIAFGAKLGQGVSRKVYQLRLNPEYVIKLEMAGRSFQNVAEWETWEWVQSVPALAKWFAPCEQISSCGMFLVQRRVEPVRSAELPKMLPAFLCDLKQENFGMLKGRFVCCDYGTVPSAIRTASRRMMRAKWR